ncbi:polysaccharide deacetylase family protein [Moritella viscosa]|nr:polysaccharide deacetylase family protein [Moritella viscosa]
MKSLLKKYILYFLNLFGMLRYLHFKNRHHITVIMLHGVMTSHKKVTWNPLRPQLSPNELRRTLQIISRYYQFITIEQCVDMLEGKIPSINNALLITFDDGYRNSIDYALPICQQFGIKPVLFVATGHIDSGLPFWFDRLDYALQQNMGELISLEYQENIYTFDARSRRDLQTSFKRFRDTCKQRFTDDIAMNQLFDSLSEMLELRSGKALRDICAKDDWSGIVSWSLLREAVKSGSLDIASHTTDHWRLDSLSESQILSQLQKSKMRIEQELSIHCRYFCYPNGNYNSLSISLLKQNGYRAAFSTNTGLCKAEDDLMTLNRFNFPSNKTEYEIIYQLNR